jgi:release factor glutamine methyltransferase
MKKNSRLKHDPVMTVKEAFHAANVRLQKAGADTPYLDSLVILSFVLNTTKEQTYMQFDSILSQDSYYRFNTLLHERERGVPVSYIRRKKEFWGLDFYVDPRVLVPRPDTETVVEAVSNLLKNDRSLNRLHDACTGSGCIAIAVAASHPEVDVSASDISPEALEVCNMNAQNILGRKIPVYKSNLLDSVPGEYDIITANPPYLTSSEAILMKSGGTPEPVSALDGGIDGLKIIRRLLETSLESLRSDGYLIIEAADWQTPEIEKLYRQYEYTRTRIVRDLAGKRRVVMGRK